MIRTYFNEIRRLLETVESQEHAKINEAAERIASSIQKGGIIHLFGCGHSHMLTEEVYYRAGGLVPVHPILHEPLMLHEGAVHSSELERKNNYAQTFMKNQDIRENDVMIVISTSGRNPVPIDVAQFSKEKGAFVIGISSMNYAKNQVSRHTSGKLLVEVVDLAINNHAPVGDALLHDEKVPVNFAPGSTVIGATISNSMIAESISIMADQNFDPPILLSGNTDGADKYNRNVMETYKDRIVF